MIDIFKFDVERTKVAARSMAGTDISEHLITLFDFTVFSVCEYANLFKDKFSVLELGVRDGESTKTFLSALGLLDSKLLSIDKEDCTAVARDAIADGKWWQIVGDSRDTKLAARVEDGSKMIVFVDTSHIENDTEIEIANWKNKLHEHGAFIFHDTNCSKDNARGVIAPIERFVGFKINEKNDALYVGNGFTVRHFPNNNGLTIVQKVI
jgi:hypothetical protein